MKIEVLEYYHGILNKHIDLPAGYLQNCVKELKKVLFYFPDMLEMLAQTEDRTIFMGSLCLIHPTCIPFK